MSAMADECHELVKFLNLYDNCDEPTPLANKRSTIFGLVITFMVRTDRCGYTRVCHQTADMRQVVSFICVALRLYTRFRIVRAPGWDDFFITLASVGRFHASATSGPDVLTLDD